MALPALIGTVATTLAPFIIQKLGSWFFSNNKSDGATKKPTVKSNPAYSPATKGSQPAGASPVGATKDGTATTRQGDWENGYEDFVKNFTTATPEQQNVLKALLPQVQDRLGSDQFDFGPIEAKSRKDFNTNVIPSLANRFSAFGGGTSTPGYQHALATAQGEHETGLAALKSEYGLKQRGMDQSLLKTLLAPQTQNLYQPHKQGFNEIFEQKRRLGELGLDEATARKELEEGFAAKIKEQNLDAATNQSYIDVSKELTDNLIKYLFSSGDSAAGTAAASSAPNVGDKAVASPLIQAAKNIKQKQKYAPQQQANGVTHLLGGAAPQAMAAGNMGNLNGLLR